MIKPVDSKNQNVINSLRDNPVDATGLQDPKLRLKGQAGQKAQKPAEKPAAPAAGPEKPEISSQARQLYAANGPEKPAAVAEPKKPEPTQTPVATPRPDEPKPSAAAKTRLPMGGLFA